MATQAADASFGNSPEFWLGPQMDYDPELAEHLAAGRIEREVRQFALA